MIDGSTMYARSHAAYHTSPTCSIELLVSRFQIRRRRGFKVKGNIIKITFTKFKKREELYFVFVPTFAEKNNSD
jgi:hypothetical protein